MSAAGLLRAWTYATAPHAGPYWSSNGVTIILLEYLDGQLEWRRVDNGMILCVASGPASYHKGKILPFEDYPQWLRDMDDYSTDVGL